jgi:hypothetical protein
VSGQIPPTIAALRADPDALIDVPYVVDGVDVVLPVPAWRILAAWADATHTCSACRGRGRYAVDSNPQRDATCAQCDGTGWST